MSKLLAVAVTSVALAVSASAVAASTERAYPQTRPSAGQLCKKADRGVVTKAKNGRKVRCTAVGTRSRWKYVVRA
jgi:hypothetical protein